MEASLLFKFKTVIVILSYMCGFIGGSFSGTVLAGGDFFCDGVASAEQKSFCSFPATSQNFLLSAGSTFSIIAANSRMLPLALQPKHWKIPRVRFAENDAD